MAEAVIGPLLARLQELAVDEARSLLAVTKHIDRLRHKLMWLQAFLREADTKRRIIPDEVTRVWLQQTRDAVFDAEDVIDHYSLHQSRWSLRLSGPILEHLAILKRQVFVRHNLSGKIKDINSRLDDIIKNKDLYKIDTTRIPKAVPWKASTSIHFAHINLDDLQQPHLPIYEDKREELENALTTSVGNEDCPVVISVVGKSGVGKTTLVRDVYKAVTKKKYFDVHVMESFAPYLTATNIQLQIVQQLTEDNENCPRNKVTEMLNEKLKDKKYLLVIDGEVSSTEWNNLLDTLLVGQKSSRIVHITQESEEPPSSYRHVHIQLNNAGHEATIELFRKRLNHMELQPEDLEKYIKEQDIHKITGGIPLAVVLLSGLVQTKEFPSEWTEVFKYLQSKQTNRLINILSLCFDDLPRELKSCFLYFAALPANTVIEARRLVCMWLAEGFLRPKVEKVGYIYINELIARNLVNLVYKGSSGNKFVSIQNKVHEFLQAEAHEASFLEVYSADDDILALTSARRLSLQNHKDKYAAFARSLPKLRSIFSDFEQEPKDEKAQEEDAKEDQKYLCCLHQRRANSKEKHIKSYIRELLNGSEFLRVISLQGIEIGDKLPDEIGNVVHLQYLGITSCSLREIPSSIGKLTSLQTLDVRETNVRDLPEEFWKIETLRHVFGFVLKLYKQTGSLKYLQTLDSIERHGDEHDWGITLGKMINLENLCVWNISAGNMEDFFDALRKLENLRTLILCRGNIPPSVFTGSSLRRLKFMVLTGELQLPPELTDMVLCLPNLIKLWLRIKNLSQEFISKLAELPSLAALTLYSHSYKDKQLIFNSGGFHRLKNIKLRVVGLTSVEVKKGALPKLEKKLDIQPEVQIIYEKDAPPKVEELDIHSRYSGGQFEVQIIDEKGALPKVEELEIHSRYSGGQFEVQIIDEKGALPKLEELEIHSRYSGGQFEVQIIDEPDIRNKIYFG